MFIRELTGGSYNIMIKAVIFDCFGVLLGNAYKVHLAEVEQVDPARAEEIRAINHASDMGILSRNESGKLISELFGMEPEEFRAEQDQVEVPNRELLAYIQSLKEQYRVALLSNINSRERLGIRFSDGELDAHFDTIVASGDEGVVKPQPEIYEITATRLGVLPSECVMIDDIAEFCEGARAVGMQAIQFKTNKQCITDLNRLLDRGDK